MGHRVKDIITLNSHNTYSFNLFLNVIYTRRVERNTEDTFTNRETAKFQGSIFTQNKALGIWNWQNEQPKKNEQ